MADYKISLGAELRTSELNKQVEKYKGDINVGAILDTSGITKTLNGYNAAPIEVGSTLNTQGITDKIKSFSEKKGRKNIKVGIDTDHLFDGVETTISSKTFKTPLKVNVDLNWAGVAGQIANPDFGKGGTPRLNIDVDLNDDAIVSAIERYQKTGKVRTIPVKVKPDFAEVDLSAVTRALENEVISKPLNVKFKISKTEINKDIAAYNQKLAEEGGKKIIFNAALRANAIDDAISNYLTKYPDKLKIPIDFKIKSDLEKNSEFETALKQRIEQYENTPVWVSAKLKPASKGFKDQISNVKVDVTATLTNAEAINNTIQQYSDKPLPVTAKLVPATTGFTSEITKTPVQIQAELAPDAINNAIANPPKTLSKLPIDVTLKPQGKDDGINKQIKQLAAIVAPLEVDVKLNDEKINSDIGNMHPATPLGVNVKLLDDDINKQIEAIVPTSPIKVNIKVNDGEIDEKTGGQKTQEPILVNVQLDRDDINKQIEAFKPTSLMKVGVKLDFATHKDKDTKEVIQKGIAQQIKEYEAKSKVKIGVELDKESVDTTVQNFKTDVPIKLGVELDTEPAEKRIEELKEEFKKFGNITINFVGADGNVADAGSGSGGRTSNAVQKFREIDIAIAATGEQIQNLNKALSDVGFNKGSIDTITKEFEELGISVRNVTSRLHNDGSVTLTVKGVDQFERAVKVMRSVDEKGNITNLGTTISQDFKETEAAFKRLKVLGKEISQLDIKIAGLDADKNKHEIEELIAQLNRLEAEYNDLFDVTERNLSARQIDELAQDIANSSSKIDATKARVADKAAAQKAKEEAKEINESFEDLKRLATEMGKIDIELAGLTDVDQDIEKFNSLKRLAKELEVEFDVLYEKIGKNLDDEQIRELNQIFANTTGAIRELNNEMSKTSEESELASGLERLKTIAKEINSLKIDIFKFEDEDNIEQAINRLEELENEATELRLILQQKFNIQSFDEVDDIAKQGEAALDSLIAKAKEARNQLAIDIKNNIKGDSNGNASKYDAELLSLENRFNKLAEQPREVKIAIDSVRTALEALKSADGTDEIIAANTRYKEVLKQVKTQLDNLELAEGGSNYQERFAAEKEAAMRKLNSLFSEGSTAAKKYGGAVEQLKNELNECGNVKGIQNVTKKINALGAEIKRTGIQTQTFPERIKNQFAKYGSYFSVASLFMYAEQAMRSMFEQVKLIDSAMTELKKVTNENDASYNQFLKNAASRSKILGTTIDGLVSSTAEFAKLGYSFEESQGLAEVANIYAVVGDEIEGVEGATQSLVSTLAAFKHEMNGMSDSDFAMSIVDKFNEVANKYSISSGGLGEALTRSASSMAAAQNTLDETIALTTAANEVVQNPEKVGNALKTMSMRLRAAKTELEEAGESTEGMAESTASLRAEIKALSGVDIMLNDNTFKSTYQILDELSQKWGDLTDIQRASITELVAGKHQGNVMSSLMANFDTARKALDTSLTSSGSAMAEHAKWSESLEARLNKLKSAWQSLSQTFMNSSFLKVGINVLTGFVNVIDEIIDKVGLLPMLLGGFAGKKIIGNIFNIAKTMPLAGGISSIGDILRILAQAFPNAAKGVSVFTAALAKSKGVIGAVTAAAKGLWAVIAAHPILAAVAAVGVAITLYTGLTESAEELADRVEDVTSKYKEQHDSLVKLKSDYDTSNEDSMISKYAKLSKGVDALGENVSLTAAEYAEYQSIVNTIADQIPSLVTGYNSQGDAILDCAGNVNALVEAYRELIIAENDAVLKNGSDIFKDFKNDIKGTLPVSLRETYGENALDHFGKLDKLLSLGEDDLDDYIENNINAMDARLISEMLEKNGIKRDVMFGDGLFDTSWETEKMHIKRAIKENIINVKSILDEASADINAYADDLGTVTEAYFSTAFLGGDGKGVGDYSHLSNRMQNIINQVTSNFDSEFYAQFLDDENPYESLTKYFNDMLKAFDSLGDAESAELEAAFDLQTKFNGGKISYGEYINELQNVSSLVDGLVNNGGLDEEVASQIKLALNTEEVTKNYDALKTRLTSDEYQLNADNVETFLKDLNASELEVVVDFIESDNADFKSALQNYKQVLDEAKAAGVDFSKTVYGNIDTNARQVLEWNSENLEKYKDELMSWEPESASWDKVKESFEGTISTVLGTSDIFGIDGKEVEIAFSTVLNTDDGLVPLSKDSVYSYIDKLIETATEDGKWDEAELLKLDAEGIEIDGQKIKGILADIGDTAKATSMQMHFAGKDGALALAQSEIFAMVEKQAKINEALNFTIGISVETENVEAVNTALAESVSAAGLSSESITILKSRYADLESQGYDLSSMFEETANGIHLNRVAVNELEDAYASQKLADVDKNLGTLKERYDELAVEIDNASDASERASLYREQQTIVQKINDLSTLASQYKGLTSAYNDWLAAEEAGQERDMYEKIIEGFESVDDEIKRGWMDDGTIKFLEMLTGKTDLASKSGQELKEIYDGLKNKIGNSKYSIRDFFTVDGDGNATNAGVYNFLETVESFEDKLGDVIKRDENDNIIGFDFEVAGGDEVIAETLGISEELVQIMVRAADDAGFVVTLEGAYVQLADLKIEAEAANDSLKKLYATSNGKFGTEHTFDFGVDNISEATTELDKAKEVLNQFKKDGVVDLTMDGAEEALKVAETLQIIKGKLEEPMYMSIDTSELQKELQEPVKLFQNFEKLTQEKDLLNLSGNDTERLNEIDVELNNIATSLYNLPEDTKVQLGIDDLGVDQIREELENGTIEIPTELTIEANMDKNLEDLVTLGLLEQGLITEEEAKIRLGIEIDKVDTSAIEEAIEKTGISEEDALTIKAFAQVFGIEDVESLVYGLGELDDKTIQAIAEVFGRIDVERLNEVVNGLDDKTVQAVVEALGEGDVEGLKTAISELDDKTVHAIAKAFGYDDVNDLYTAIDNLDPKTVQAIAEVLGITDVDSLKQAIDRLTNKNVDVVANTSGESEVNSLKSAIDKIKDKTVTITTKVKRFFSNLFGGGDDDGDGSGANGTANVNGTAGRAFKQGSWGTKNSGTALVGELGRKILRPYIVICIKKSI